MTAIHNKRIIIIEKYEVVWDITSEHNLSLAPAFVPNIVYRTASYCLWPWVTLICRPFNCWILIHIRFGIKAPILICRRHMHAVPKLYAFLHFFSFFHSSFPLPSSPFYRFQLSLHSYPPLNSHFTRFYSTCPFPHYLKYAAKFWMMLFITNFPVFCQCYGVALQSSRTRSCIDTVLTSARINDDYAWRLHVWKFGPCATFCTSSVF